MIENPKVQAAESFLFRPVNAGLSAEIVAFRLALAKQIVGIVPLPAGVVSRYVGGKRFATGKRKI
jgi:hypothetical protein